MKYILLLLFLPLISFSQKRKFVDTFTIVKDFKTQIIQGMHKHHSHYRTNDFYNYNVNKNAVYETPDTMIYKVKFITNTNGNLLWDSNVVFTKSDNSIYCVVSELKMLKKSEFMRSPEYINISLDDLEDTKGNRMNINAIKREVSLFFNEFKPIQIRK